MALLFQQSSFIGPSATERWPSICNGIARIHVQDHTQILTAHFRTHDHADVAVDVTCLSRTRHRVDKRASNLFVLWQTAYARPVEKEDQSTWSWLLLITWLPHGTRQAANTLDETRAPREGIRVFARRSYQQCRSYNNKINLAVVLLYCVRVVALLLPI